MNNKQKIWTVLYLKQQAKKQAELDKIFGNNEDDE